MIRLPRLSHERLSARIQNGKILERDHSVKTGFDLKVVLAEDGMVYKFFRVRRFFSSNLISPYARRFAGNARRLNAARIPAPDVREVFYVSALQRQVAVYPWIEGRTLVDFLSREESPKARRGVFFALGKFMAGLHENGILFHAGHLNNYVRTPDGGLALIDVTDVQFRRGPLDRKLRLKNIRKLARKPVDHELLNQYGWEALLEGYQANSLGTAALTVREIRAVASG